MRVIFVCVMMCVIGCVQVEDGQPVKPVAPVTPDVVTPDLPANVDQVFLSKILTDTSLTKVTCMRYAAFFTACKQSFTDRTDVNAMGLLEACFKSAEQFINPSSAMVTEELKKLESVQKTRDSLASEFGRLASTMLAAAARK